MKTEKTASKGAKKERKAPVRAPVYRFCRLCGHEAATCDERMTHGVDHGIVIDTDDYKKVFRSPRLVWAKTKPKEFAPDVASLLEG